MEPNVCTRNGLHNTTVLTSLSEGDLVQFKRGIYSHWGVYVGDEDIVHLSGDGNDGLNAPVQAHHLFTVSGQRFDKAKVCKEKYWKIVGDDLAYKNNDKDHKWKPLSPSEVVKNALAKIGQINYNILFENCEHFAKWCRYGKAKSDQVDNLVTGLAVGMAFGLVVGLVQAITKVWGNKEEEEDKRKERRQEL